MAIVNMSTGEITPNGGRDIAIAAEAAREETLIKASFARAHMFPRNEIAAFESVMKSLDRYNFAKAAIYVYPRGGTDIVGPSINLAEEFSRNWGNIRLGLTIIHDDDNSRSIEGWAMDLQTNNFVAMPSTFEKKIQRKQKNGPTVWIKIDDERELRELTARHGAILMRNAIFKLIPKDMVDDAVDKAKAVLKKGDSSKDPKVRIKQILVAFSQLKIYQKDLEGYLGHSVFSSKPDEIAKLEGVYTSIKDGAATKDDYFSQAAVELAEIEKLAQELGQSIHLDDITDENRADILAGFRKQKK